MRGLGVMRLRMVRWVERSVPVRLFVSSSLSSVYFVTSTTCVFSTLGSWLGLLFVSTFRCVMLDDERLSLSLFKKLLEVECLIVVGVCSSDDCVQLVVTDSSDMLVEELGHVFPSDLSFGS